MDGVAGAERVNGRTGGVEENVGMWLLDRDDFREGFTSWPFDFRITGDTGAEGGGELEGKATWVPIVGAERG